MPFQNLFRYFSLKPRQFEMFWSFHVLSNSPAIFYFSHQSNTLQEEGGRKDQKISNDLTFRFYSKCDYRVSISSKKMHLLFQEENSLSLNGSATPIRIMGCRQYLPLSVVQLKDKHCRKPPLP